jgi:hypothetical protein
MVKTVCRAFLFMVLDSIDIRKGSFGHGFFSFYSVQNLPLLTGIAKFAIFAIIMSLKL